MRGPVRLSRGRGGPPTCKLLIAGNHRPRLTSFGEALRRRLHLVPFGVTIPAVTRDKRLFERLRAEADGILAWLVEGCRAWRSGGFAPPAAVIEAGEEYFRDEDLIGRWIAEQCETGPNLKDTAHGLYESWKSHAEGGGHPPGSKKTLGDALAARGFKRCPVARGSGWSGLRRRRAAGGEP